MSDTDKYIPGLTRYVILRYVPNTVAGERINIGVLATDGSCVVWRPVEDWERIKVFGGEDISFLQDFSLKMHESIHSGILSGRAAAALMQDGQDWEKKIQMSHVMSKNSLEAFETFVEKLTQRFLKSSVAQQAEAQEVEQ